ncbi:helix-turn-helix domain-containing protein [Desulfallas thermosapovorans]|uniref:Helix-turn-helix protein n=1 Tax=Desulfallas thermosapovorans DSM 6562 TaxID=1121431 RepID=A0A5S4ZNX4_9FIRM|nr:helix-turn-helix transcriptional regulator [Desulfallas thermosapovorans]TYO94539.1 helix-turn-helix protein [Desulfallas thermosapovorans DSM 6562]
MQLDFGLRLSRYREAKKMTCAQLAESAGLSVTFIKTLEEGKKSPTLRTMEKLAAALGVKVTDLLDEQAREVS